jgi:hypothetical protein
MLKVGDRADLNSGAMPARARALPRALIWPFAFSSLTFSRERCCCGITFAGQVGSLSRDGTVAIVVSPPEKLERAQVVVLPQSQGERKVDILPCNLQSSTRSDRPPSSS